MCVLMLGDITNRATQVDPLQPGTYVVLARLRWKTPLLQMAEVMLAATTTKTTVTHRCEAYKPCTLMARVVLRWMFVNRAVCVGACTECSRRLCHAGCARRVFAR